MGTVKGPNHQGLRFDLAEFIPAKRLIDDPLRTLAYGTDASFYRLIPKLVVRVVDEAEVIKVLRLAHAHKTPVTFRAAGTSLSGQAVTDSVLVVLEGNAWRDYEIQETGELIRLQPGIIGAQANAYLAPIGRKIGPDPASIATCKIGGIAANNASGMCCGVAQNSYQTLHSMRVIFADGALLDTGDTASCDAFRESHGELLDQITALGDKARGDEALAARIREKFKIKNTTGYSLNALVDYSNPFDILQHLMIGSEGTLGFIAEITYKTVPEHPHKASALVFFPDVETACRAVAILKSEPVDAVEMMDRAAIHSVEDKPGMPAGLKGLPETAAALLIETRDETEAGLNKNIGHIENALAPIETIGEWHFTPVPEEFNKLWAIRKGLFPSVGSVREVGTTVVIEDIAFPVPKLAAGTVELQALFKKHGYDNAIIFGHALEGNLHFVITPAFGLQEEIDRYAAFMDDLAELVVGRYDGSLKAEHSTGRNMAPFVEMEWGAEAFALMQEIKQLFDPLGLLNPGVILNDDPQVHIKNLKPMPAADPIVDRCIECGFCEPVCPSRNLSLTPRQRIVILRELARLREDGSDVARLAKFEKQYDVDGQGTCAADSLCATRCPVGIDTGAMMKQLRQQARGGTAKSVGNWIDGHMAGMTSMTRFSFGAVKAVSSVTGPGLIEGATKGLRTLSFNRLPTWDRWMPRAAGEVEPRVLGEKATARVVYIPSCASRSMGTSTADGESRDLHEVIVSLLAKAGIEVVLPEGLDGLCCGMPFSSKGLEDTASQALKRVEDAVWAASENGALPVLCDTSPCAMRMVEGFTQPLDVHETTGFIREHVLPRLKKIKEIDSVALHIACSARKQGWSDDLMALAQACAKQVFTPEEEGCCGFAGDKGFNVPELNASALSRLKQQLPAGCEAGYSNSRTCEIGLSRHAGIPYRSLAYLVDECYDKDG